MLFTYYKMKILEIMILAGIFSQNIVGERHNLKIKRQIIPPLHNEGVADYNSLQHLNENQIFQERYLNRNEEMVGLFPFGILRGAARHFTRRVNNRAHFHHPHLLAPTPSHILQDEDKMEEKKTDRHDVNQFNPILQSPQLHHDVYVETSPSPLPTMQNHYEPLGAGKIICNFYDPKETMYEQPESKTRHSSEQEPHDAENPFQMRHFHHKGNIYSLISKHLQKHRNLFDTIISPDEANSASPTPYSGSFQNNHHPSFNKDGPQAYGQNNNLPQSSTTYPILPTNGEKITINQNFQISQIDGNNNGVSQSQTSNKNKSSTTIKNDLTFNTQDNQNYQASQIDGSYNAVSQSQASHKNHLNTLQDNINEFFNNQNDQISDIFGSNNAVTQSQQSNQHHSYALPDNYFTAHDQRYPQYSNLPNDNSFQIDGNQNFQASSINGNNNVVTQGQSSNRNSVGHDIVGKPYLINFEDVRPNYFPGRSHEQFSSVKRKKRQIKIWNLITDPNAQLDVSQTIENVGHAARKALEDEKHPSFYIKNAVGSAKDAFISSMRIIPQSFIVPSNYKIVGKTDEQNMMLGANAHYLQSNNKNIRNRMQPVNSNLLENVSDSKMRTSPKFLHEKFDDVRDQDQFVKTYAKVGSMVRDSVRSSKETLNHIGNAYSNARKAVATARHSAPNILMKSMRIPEIRRNFQRKKVGIVGSQNDFQDDFVGASEVMSSFGFLTPKPQKVNFKRNVGVTNPSNLPTAHNNIYINPNQALDDRTVEKSRLLNIQVIGELLAELENAYNSAYNNKSKERNSNQQQRAEIEQFLDTRNTFDVLKSFVVSNDDVFSSNLQANEFSSRIRRPEPQITNTDYENKAIGFKDENKCKNNPKTENLLKTYGYNKFKFPCPEKLNERRSENLADGTEYNEKSRISMTIGDKLVTPYMGKIKHVNTKPYYDNYENDIELYDK